MQTVTALFDDRMQAQQAADRLRAHGIGEDRIHIVSTDDGSYGSERRDEDDGFLSMFNNLFMSDEDRYTYAEGVKRGGVTVSVDADDDEVDRAVDILEDSGAVNLDEREQSWRGEGWAGALPAGTTNETRRGRGDRQTGEAVIPITQEELRIGKREVNTGRVRVHSRVVETPVEETVNLREERVNVQRRPVNRPIEAGDDAFREQAVEVEVHSEEPVVAKQARVVEEVVVSKNAAERTETVRDTVRRTEVDVEDETDRGSRSGRKRRST